MTSPGLPTLPLDRVDGKPRYDVVASFLASRGIILPWGDPSDPPDRETVCGLGNRKNGYFLDHLQKHVVSASRNMRAVLDAAGIPLDRLGLDGGATQEGPP